MSVINKYHFGKIIIDNRPYHTDIIIFPNRVKNNWRRKNGHSLCIKDLECIIEYKPDVLIIGTGMFGLMRVNNFTRTKIKENGINNIIIKKTREACKEYNQDKTIKKVAALHITC